MATETTSVLNDIFVQTDTIHVNVLKEVHITILILYYVNKVLIVHIFIIAGWLAACPRNVHARVLFILFKIKSLKMPKWIIRSCKSKKTKQDNGQKRKRTPKYTQSFTQCCILLNNKSMMNSCAWNG